MNYHQKLVVQNARFYEAFEKGDIHLLEGVWSHADDVRCVHPGCGMLTGWAAIRKSWEEIFSSATRLRFSLRNVAARPMEPLGIVTLVEEIVFRDGPTMHSASVLATNLFELIGGEWRMIHHHGSLIAEKDEGHWYQYN